MRRLATTLAATALGMVTALADQGHEHAGAGDSERLGKVDFPISCNEASQGAFARAAAALHSFWYKEALGRFSKLAGADPDCAMAHWGVAMGYWNQIWAPPRAAALESGSAAAERAKALGGKTERERGFIEAIVAFYKNHATVEHRTRAAAYTAVMERLHREHPNDTDVGTFFALALLASADPLDRTYVAQRKAGEIAERFFKANREHPGAAHYIIHAYDYPALANGAREAADQYASAAPVVPHALHMPSHIYVLIGDWERTIRSNLVAQAAERDRGVPEDRLHALDYMVYAYLQRGQDAEAAVVLDLAQQIEEELLARKYETPFRARPFHGAAMPARFALERRRWDEAASLQPRSSFYPYADSVWYFARAIGLAKQGNTAQAQEDLGALKALHEKLVAAKNGYWARQVEAQHHVASGVVAAAEGKSDVALSLLRAAAEAEHLVETHDTLNPGPIGLTANEALGEFLIEMKRGEEALQAFETSLKHAPNRLRSYYGAAKAAAILGQRERAAHYYTRLLDLAAFANPDRSEINEARAFLARAP